MLDAIVHFTQCSEASTLASARIAKFLAERNRCPLIDSPEDADYIFAPTVNKLGIVNSPYAFCGFREVLECKMKDKETEVVWIQNDYAIEIPKAILPRIVGVWSTCEDSVFAHETAKLNQVVENHYVNWNQLSLDAGVLLPLKWNQRYNDRLYYYGAFRSGRRSAFDRYLGPKSPYKIVVSSSHRAKWNFWSVNLKIKHEGPVLNPVYAQSLHKVALMIQDTESDEHYHSPPNRFYEAISADCAIAFDVPTVKTYETAGLAMKNAWIVNDAKELQALMSNAEKLHKSQKAFRASVFKKNDLIKTLEKLEKS